MGTRVQHLFDLVVTNIYGAIIIKQRKKVIDYNHTPFTLTHADDHLTYNTICF